MSLHTRTAFAAALACAALSFACGEKAPDQPPATMAPATMAPATMAPAATMPAVSSGDFGVAECDAYMKKYLACVESKVPEAQRAMMRQQLDQNKAVWKQTAATPQGKAAMASACTQADQQSGPAMKAYGCSW